LDRFFGEEDYFDVGKKRYVSGLINIWELILSPTFPMPSRKPGTQGAGLRLSQFEMSGNALVGHLGECPGAIIVGLQSIGYVLLWHKQWGMHPYTDGHDTDGHEDKVIEFKGRGQHLLPAGRLVSPALHCRQRTGAISCRALRQPHSSARFQDFAPECVSQRGGRRLDDSL
jgi:hypothetical protein